MAELVWCCIRRSTGMSWSRDLAEHGDGEAAAARLAQPAGVEPDLLERA